MDLNEYLAECSKTFADFIRKNLEKHRNTLSKILYIVYNEIL